MACTMRSEKHYQAKNYLPKNIFQHTSVCLFVLIKEGKEVNVQVKL